MDPNYYQDIPKEFFSFETGQPFERCIECNTYLLDGQDYVIEKALRKYEGYDATDVIFDYAMCMSCAMKMRDEFSIETSRKLDAYFNQYIGSLSVDGNPTEKDLDMNECLGSCLIKNTDVSMSNEYQIYAHCKGNKLFKGVRPYMISHAAIDEILPLISNQTQDFLNGFYDKHFSPDPSIIEPIPTDRLVFI